MFIEKTGKTKNYLIWLYFINPITWFNVTRTIFQDAFSSNYTYQYVLQYFPNFSKLGDKYSVFVTRIPISAHFHIFKNQKITAIRHRQDTNSGIQVTQHTSTIVSDHYNRLSRLVSLFCYCES